MFVKLGRINKAHPEFPKPENGDEWKMEVAPLRSAYKDYYGNEPEFTNYAQVQNDPVFIETIDYIMLSENAWHVNAVLPLPTVSATEGPLPNKDEPSDHIMLAAELSI